MKTNYKLFTRKSLIRMLIQTLLIANLVWGTVSNVNAQDFRLITHRGFESTVGIKTFTLQSDIKELQGLSIVEEGGYAGITLGNSFITTSFKAVGFYYSISAVPYTTNLFESGIFLNFLPLQLLKTKNNSKVEPYFTTGTYYCMITFRGHYLDPDGATSNYSYSDQPYVGRTHPMLITTGLGVNWNILHDPDFVQLFVEVSYGAPFTHVANPVLAKTTITGLTSLMVGVRFGAKR